jgi:ribokinase
MVGRVGDDPVGREYLEGLARHGVGTDHVALTPGVATGTAVIYVDDDGDNMIVVAPGANSRVGTDDLSRLDRLGPDDVVLLQLELPLDVVVEAVRRAAARGARVVLNLSPAAPLPAETLAACDPVVVNEHEAQQLAGTGAPVPSLLVTLGPQGSRWDGIAVAATAVVPVDTTGAGDAYCGTLAARLCLGDDRAEAMTAASAAAARTVLHPGAQPDPGR